MTIVVAQRQSSTRTMEPNAPAFRNPDSLLESGKTQAMRAAEQLRNAAASTVQQFRTVAEERADQLRAAAGEQTGTMRAAAEAQAEQLRDAAEEQWSQARTQVQDWQQELETYVRANPTKSILATFGLGLVLGLMMRRR
jgi:ElaB/YqjD/DUF883 family membrane-anchored ribosome-binding protein